MRYFYYLLHKFIGCPESDLVWGSNKIAVCKKCGRYVPGFDHH